MQNSLFNVAFAEKLMQFIIEKNEMSWIPPHDFESFLLFEMNQDLVQNVGSAICNLISKAESQVTACKNELEDMGCSDAVKFSRYALGAARHYFTAGYTHLTFLTYCSMIGGVALMLYKADRTDIPNCAVEVIAIVLTAHIMTRRFMEMGGYIKLQNFCAAYNSVIEKQNSRDSFDEEAS